MASDATHKQMAVKMLRIYLTIDKVNGVFGHKKPKDVERPGWFLATNTLADRRWHIFLYRLVECLWGDRLILLQIEMSILGPNSSNCVNLQAFVQRNPIKRLIVYTAMLGIWGLGIFYSRGVKCGHPLSLGLQTWNGVWKTLSIEPLLLLSLSLRTHRRIFFPLLEKRRAEGILWSDWRQWNDRHLHHWESETPWWDARIWGDAKHEFHTSRGA